MRDGVALNATIYRPLPDETPRTVILTVTPYSSDTYHERGKAFAERGFVFAIVDVRGRGSSEGDFVPMTEGRADGYDLVEWLAAAPFCDGNVAMWGGSYAGMNQWLAATQLPPHLRAIAPAASALMGYDMPFHGGIYIAWNLQWLTLTSGKTVQFNAVADAAYWRDTFARLYREHRPFAELDLIAGSAGTVWPVWRDHQQLDEYWDSHNPSAAELARIGLFIFTITGLYDDCCVSSLQLVAEHAAAAPPSTTPKHDVLIGPWDHAGTRAPRRHVGDLTFAPHSMLDLNRLHAQWYAWAIHGAPRPAILRDRITYYVSGLEEWRYASTLDEIATGELRLYLDAGVGQGRDAFNAGRLVPDARSASEPVTFTYDPLDTRPADLIAPVDINRPMTLSDQTLALNLFGNGLVYHTEPLSADLVLAGMPSVELWISLDVADTDLKVAIFQIMPDGRSLILGEDMLRARHRKSPRAAELVPLGAIEPYRFQRLTWNSRLIVKASRLRLIVSCPNSIYEQKNYNSGGDVMRESAADARTAHVTVHHAPPHASSLTLKVGDALTDRRLTERDVAPYLLTNTDNRPQG